MWSTLSDTGNAPAKNLNNFHHESLFDETNALEGRCAFVIRTLPGGTMIWSLAKLEDERQELIEVISNLKAWQHSPIEDSHVIALNLTAHMMRLSELEEEILTNRREQDLAACATIIRKSA